MPEKDKIPPDLTRRVLEGHTSAVWGCAVDPQGRWIVSASRDQTLRVWDAATGALLRILEGHTGSVTGCAVDPQGQWIVSASYDRTLRVWDAATGTLLRVLEGHTSWVLGCAVDPQGQWIVSAAGDETLRVWDAATGALLRVLEGHTDGVFGCAVDPQGQWIVSASNDNTLRVWDAATGALLRVLEGHAGMVFGCAVDPQGRWVVSASRDQTLRVWDAATGALLRILEGHTDAVLGCTVDPQGRWVVSASRDQTLRVWDAATGAQLRVLEGHTNSVEGCTVDPQGRWIVSASNDHTLRVWDVAAILGEDFAIPSLQYTNAKVALVGDSGVGKTGLGLVLSGQQWKPTESTHGRHIWTLQEETVTLDEGQEVTRETLLWDLAGQPGYRVIHQLSLTEVAAALVVFDAHSETDPFAGVRHWDRALRQAQKVSGANALPLKKFLVAARIDRGGISASRERRERILKKYGFDGYFETSAKEGLNVGDLLDAVKAAIAWDMLPFVTSNELFQTIKAFLLREKEAGRLICSIDDLYRGFQKRGDVPEAYRGEDVQDEFRTCISLVQGRGLIRQLNFGDLVLLQPELLDAYAASLINAAKSEPDGLGSIAEEDARTGQFAMPEGERIADRAQEKLLLIAMVEDMLRHEIALREEADLVFPSQFTRSNPDLPDPEGKEVVFRFEGPVMNVYATLVVRLAHSGMFTLRSEDMWRNAAIFGSAAGGRFGLALGGEIDEGSGDLALFYQNGAGVGLKAQFEHFIHAHLERKAVPGTFQRRRIFICSECSTPVSEIVAQRAAARGKKTINCPVCDTPVSLAERKERMTAADKAALEKMHRQADIERDRAAAVSVIEGKRATNDYDVFLCHNSRDKKIVKQIGEQLLERGILPWLDEWDIPPGALWVDELKKQIKNIESAAVFLGPKGQGVWQDMEIRELLNQFLKKKRPLIPVILHGRKGTPRLPFFLNQFQAVDFRKEEPDPLQQLIWGITGERGFER